MKIVLKTTNIQLEEKIKKFLEEKINSLEKFAEDFFYNDSKGKGKPKIEAWVEIAKLPKHRKGKVFYAECQMHFPGKSIRAESTEESLEAAIEKMKDELKNQIIHYKEKIITKYEKGAKMAKKKLKLSKFAQ
jgi:ribosomal subunit interface protein